MDIDLKSVQEARDFVKKAKSAQEILLNYSQEKVDRLVALMAEAGYRAAGELAVIAHEESGLGRIDSKTQKNRFATRGVYEYIKDMKTVGVIDQDTSKKVWKIATPMGIVAAIIPITNPTSTALYKMIIAMKARCAIILSPHPRGVECVKACVTCMKKAITAIGAPEDAVNCLSLSTLAATDELMKNRDTRLILATGGSGLVKAAYSSGKPALGVGPGNVPAFIEKTADISHAIRCLVVSQGFDWGTLCSSEQAVICDAAIYSQCIAEFKRQRAHICNDYEIKLLEALMPPGSAINPDLVGKSPFTIAGIAGFSVPKDTTILIARQHGVGDKFLLSREKLAPILALYIEDGWQAACSRCKELLLYGGAGHTLAIHSKDQRIISTFALELPASRIIINGPSSQGGVGYGTGLAPAMTLGCGAKGGNITSDNITPMHLLNIKRVGMVKENWFSDVNSLSPTIKNPQQHMVSRWDPFEYEFSAKRRPYIGPHNNPNI